MSNPWLGSNSPAYFSSAKAVLAGIQAFNISMLSSTDLVAGKVIHYTVG